MAILFHRFVTGYYEQMLHRRFGCAYSPPVPARPRAVDPAYADGVRQTPRTPDLGSHAAASPRPAKRTEAARRARLTGGATPSVTNHRSHLT
jgi:hypothetical protein